jgi:hypothetical protein
VLTQGKIEILFGQKTRIDEHFAQTHSFSHDNTLVIKNMLFTIGQTILGSRYEKNWDFGEITDHGITTDSRFSFRQ